MKERWKDIKDSLLWIKGFWAINSNDRILEYLLLFLGIVACNQILNFTQIGSMLNVGIGFAVSYLLVGALVYLNKLKKSRYLIWLINFSVGITIAFFTGLLFHLIVLVSLLSVIVTQGKKSPEVLAALICVPPIILTILVMQIVFDIRRRNKNKKH